MAETTDDVIVDVRGVMTRWWRRWPSWAGYAAVIWTGLYGTLGLYWAVGGAGFPFGVGNDPGAELSALGGVQAESGAPVIAVLGALGVGVAFTMGRTLGRGLSRVAVLAFGWTIAVVLALIVPDYRVLVVTAYAPIFVIGAPFGLSSSDFFAAFTWPLVNQLFCIVGGVSWGMATLAYQRHSRGACENCGRVDAESDTIFGAGIDTDTEATTDSEWPTHATTARWARWGRWATAIAVGIPLIYAITRWAWFLGVPLGITDEFYREGQESGMWAAGAALGTIAAGGAVLTLGLVQSWGEVFPRWIPFLAGKRVPIWLAVVPASLVAVLVTTAGLMFVRLQLTGVLDDIFGEGNWGAVWPELLWPIWGVALAVATLAYYYRRRGQCHVCGRGRSHSAGIR